MKLRETRAKVRIYGPNGSSEIELFVDTGATLTKIPQSVARKLGLIPRRRVRVELADGRRVLRPLTFAEIEYDNVRAPVQVLFGSDGEEALMGLTALENLALKVNPLEQRLERATFKEYASVLES